MLLAVFQSQKAVTAIVLGGVISAAFFTALTSLVKYVADPYNQLPAIVYFLMGPDWAPDLEALQALPHDLVLVASRETANRLAARGFRAYCLTWRDPDSVFTTLDLLGDVMCVTPCAVMRYPFPPFQGVRGG